MVFDALVEKITGNGEDSVIKDLFFGLAENCCCVPLLPVNQN